MPIYSDVVASRLEKYRAQLERVDGNDADIDSAILKYVICQLVDAAFGGGGGGGTSTSAATIAQGINQSTDIDTIVARLTDIDANQINQSSVKSAIESATNLSAIVNRLISIDSKTIGQADIVAAIQSAADIDAIILALNQLVTNIGYPVGARTIAQSQSVSIASDQRVPIDNQRINGTAIATGIGAADGGTQRVGLSIDSKISGYGYESKATITRPTNTTAYVANSVYGGVFELPGFGASGEHVILSGVRVIFSSTTLPIGMAEFTLFLYSGTPPSAVADGGSFSIPAIDRSKLLTPKGISLENAETAIGGGSVVLQVDNRNVQLKLAAGVTAVWGYLVTRSAFTPSAGTTAEITTVGLGV
jgi:hypothetical protein